MIQVEYGVRLTDTRPELEYRFTVDVPVRSLDHAEEVTNWHNDPQHESIYEAEIVWRQKVITNWEPVPFPARNVTT
jgi:hypothetical protein